MKVPLYPFRESFLFHPLFSLGGRATKRAFAFPPFIFISFLFFCLKYISFFEILSPDTHLIANAVSKQKNKTIVCPNACPRAVKGNWVWNVPAFVFYVVERKAVGRCLVPYPSLTQSSASFLN